MTTANKKIKISLILTASTYMQAD